jgi:hypothetical protein
VGSLTGRALNRFGEIALAPFENIIIGRELQVLIDTLDQVESVEDWSKVKSMMSNWTLVDRLLEPLRSVD